MAGFSTSINNFTSERSFPVEESSKKSKPAKEQFGGGKISKKRKRVVEIKKTFFDIARIIERPHQLQLFLLILHNFGGENEIFTGKQIFGLFS